MKFDLTIAEKYDVANCFYFYQCAVNANYQPGALAQLARLDTIVQKAINQKRLDDDEINRIILFVTEYPDLLEEAKKFGVGLNDLIVKAYEQKPYGPKAAETIRMAYYC
jgi:hypothetical protein